MSLTTRGRQQAQRAAGDASHGARPSGPLGLGLAACAIALALAGCTAPQAFTRNTDPQPEQTAALDDHVRWLERAIERMERSRAQGRGAQGRGSRMTVYDDGRGASGRRDGTPIERLAAAEKDLAAAQASIAERERVIDQLRRQVATASNETRTLAERNDYLARAEASLAVARDALAARDQELNETHERLDAAELARLKAERDHHVIAAAVLRLQPGQGRELGRIQEDVREMLRAWERQRRNEGWNPPAEGAAPAPAAPAAEPAHGDGGHAPAPAHGGGH